MEFKGFTGKKKRRVIKREVAKEVEEPFRCVIRGDKVPFLNTIKLNDKSKLNESSQTKIDQPGEEIDVKEAEEKGVVKSIK